MSDDDESKWNFIDKRLAKRAPQLPIRTETTPAPQAEIPDERPQGLVESWRSTRIQRNQRIEMLTEKTKGQLAAWKHFVESQLVVSKERIDLHVEVELMEIGRQHLLNLQEIGISNFVDRQRALEDLTKRSTDQLSRINAMDAPEFMKQKLLDAVVKGYEQLFDKIQSEEIRTPRGK